MLRKVCFFAKDLARGSSRMRGYQVARALGRIIPNRIEVGEPDPSVRSAIIFWIGPIRNKYRMHSSNIHVLDVIDKYIYGARRKRANTLAMYQCILVGSERMKSYFQTLPGCPPRVVVVPHHWDPRLSAVQCSQDRLRFGYMGATATQRKRDRNFVHFRDFGKRYSIEFFDTEVGRSVTGEVARGKDFPVVRSSYTFPDTVPFNCAISLRPVGSLEYKFKTTAKVATAAALGQNIITTGEWAVRDYLPPTYPFLVHNPTKPNIEAMFRKVISDYRGDKTLWTRGLKMMEEVRSRLSIENVVKLYADLIRQAEAMPC